MLRAVAALLIALAGPAVAQTPSKPTILENVAPACDHLYQIDFAQGSAVLGERPAAITQIFAESHAQRGTRTRILVRQAGPPGRKWQALAARRIAAVRAVLARFGIPRARTEVEFEVPEEPSLIDSIALLEIMSEAERDRRAMPLGMAC